MSVFSKIIDRTSAKYGIRQEQLTRGVVGAVTTLYLLKLGYPHIVASVKRRSATSGERRISDNGDCNGNNEDNDDNETEKKRRQMEKATTNGSRISEHSTEKDVLGPKLLTSGKVGLVNLGLDKAFLKQLLALLKIMVPGWRTREAGLLTCATFTLLARTFISVYVATLEGQIVKRIVLKDVRGFFLMMARWFAIAFPATFVNSAIRYLEGRLALSFRWVFKKKNHNLFFLSRK